MSSVASSMLSTVYNVVTAGLGGIGLIAFFQRWIVPGAAYEEMRDERDQWHDLYDRERQAHQATRDAMTAASQRADAGIEAAKVTTALIDALRGSEDAHHHQPGTEAPGRG